MLFGNGRTLHRAEKMLILSGTIRTFPKKSFMKRFYCFVLLAACAGALFPGCGDDPSDEPAAPAPAPVPQRLAAPEVRVSEVGATSFRASWNAVPQAGSYSYELFAQVNGTPSRVEGRSRYASTDVLFEGLTASTAYEVRVRALAPDGGAHLDSNDGTAQTVTLAPAPTAPWVEIALTCVDLNGKLAVQAANSPNALCAHYYLSTANVNVIGDGLDTEAQVIEYLLLDYEENVPGIYRDKEVLTCNNNGTGLDAGQKLFYYVVGEDASGKTGALNWVWFEVPAHAGDEVVILDSPDR